MHAILIACFFALLCPAAIFSPPREAPGACFHYTKKEQRNEECNVSYHRIHVNNAKCIIINYKKYFNLLLLSLSLSLSRVESRVEREGI